jgi:16S rRNA (adenine(1408)-N(1))-methyltransferase
LFVYRSALQNPQKFFIGVDANPRALRKISEKIYRKPTKGGAPNVLFVQAAVENLPEELTGIAREVFVLFPWGSLLRAFALGEIAVLRGVRRICAEGALLTVVIGLDPQVDRTQIDQLQLPDLTDMYVKTSLAPKYESAGFRIVYAGIPDGAPFEVPSTTWAKRIRFNRNRIRFILRALAI